MMPPWFLRCDAFDEKISAQQFFCTLFASRFGSAYRCITFSRSDFRFEGRIPGRRQLPIPSADDVVLHEPRLLARAVLRSDNEYAEESAGTPGPQR